ncbi:ATP-binding protein, partial [Shimia sp.]|uniref:ATP-binding protein n=1 Tax=Shimia sp. TaxID=1954381 RepID=UPI00356758A8
RIVQGGRLTLHVAHLGRDLFHWQIQKQELSGATVAAKGVPRLPMLTVGQRESILFMNAAARDVLGSRALNLGDVFGPDGCVAGEINTVTTAEGSRQCLVAEFPLSAGRREIYLLPTTVPALPGNAAFFDALPVALLKLSVDGRVVMANRAARDLLGQPIGPGTALDSLMEGLGRSIRDWLSEAAAGRGGQHSEFLLVRRSDREIFVQVALKRVVEGEEVSLITVLSDATELKTLEAQFVQSQKMQAIGQLAGGVAHDFNNLLTAITGHCDLLLLGHDPGDPAYRDLVQINENANRAAALVGQLLAFSRKQNLRPETLDMRDTLADLTHLLNRLVGETITLELIHDPDLPPVRADRRQLEQVLMNLVVNARDAMPGGGKITIRTRDTVLAEPLERDRATVPAGHYVGIEVEDQGCGIVPEKQQKIFEPFYTTKRTGEGTGLGLSTAYGIVKQTGGYIFVDSRPGEGTVFRLLLPAHHAPAEPETPAPAGEGAAPAAPGLCDGGGVVLLVEDEAAVRSFASRALRLHGFTVLEAGSGEEALELLGEEALHVDLFVSDVIMPGLDGPGWVRRARETRPDTGVIFMSGYAQDSFTDKQAEIDGSVFLPKPFSLNDLTSLVRRTLGDGQAMLS